MIGSATLIDAASSLRLPQDLPPSERKRAKKDQKTSLQGRARSLPHEDSSNHFRKDRTWLYKTLPLKQWSTTSAGACADSPHDPQRQRESPAWRAGSAPGGHAHEFSSEARAAGASATPATTASPRIADVRPAVHAAGADPL
jgi:hypothetical protein